MWLTVIDDPELLVLGHGATFAARPGEPLEVSGYESAGVLARGDMTYSEEPLLMSAVLVAVP